MAGDSGFFCSGGEGACGGAWNGFCCSESEGDLMADPLQVVRCAGRQTGDVHGDTWRELGDDVKAGEHFVPATFPQGAGVQRRVVAVT